jgi:hypothetical protein
MNDFTKEELEELIQGITWWLDGDACDFNEKLIEKIQSMIENYCEHDRKHYDIKIYEHDNKKSDSTVKIICECLKCEKILI